MLIPVILAGGAGTRLWPVSRQGYPKLFMQLADGQSLLLKTFLRAGAVARGGQILTVTNRDYYFMSKDELAKGRSITLSSVSPDFSIRRRATSRWTTTASYRPAASS